MLLRTLLGLLVATAVAARTCNLRPLGAGRDDTGQILAAIDRCGTSGVVNLAPGVFNITQYVGSISLNFLTFENRKMTWTLNNAVVHLHGTLSFVPDVQFWLNASNTYRVVDIQSQASWFVLTGKNFVVDAHGTGGIDGNGQTWWDFFTTRTREDGDGRPISLTLFEAQDAVVRNFKIFAQPFWCNTVARSSRVLYDGMTCNATNTNPAFAGQKYPFARLGNDDLIALGSIVPNTDGINTYRSDRVTMLNWDIICGDDCLAIKGNSTNIIARDITCRGGNGIAVGSLGMCILSSCHLLRSVLILSHRPIRRYGAARTLQPTVNADASAAGYRRECYDGKPADDSPAHSRSAEHEEWRASFFPRGLRRR